MSASASFLTDLAFRNLINQVTHQEELARHLQTQPSARAYVGFDPTADSLTIGNLVGIVALRRWQLAGHTPVVVMGGGTGLIGDPSGKSAERQLRTREEVCANVESQRRIFERVLDFRESTPNRAILLNNLDWLGGLSYLDALRDIGKHFSVNMMVQKDSVKERLNNRDQGISYTEFSYMILQAYDFAHLFQKHGVSVQMGGSDQFGNIVVGIDLIRKLGQELLDEIQGCNADEDAANESDQHQQASLLKARGDELWEKFSRAGMDEAMYVARRKRYEAARAHSSNPFAGIGDISASWRSFGLTWPLVTKADGTKFGKTESGAIWLTAKRDESDTSTARTSPYQFYQFWLNTADADVVKFLKSFTLMSHEQITDLERIHASHPEKREAHKALAKHMTELLHGPEELGKVEQATRALFAKPSEDGPFVLPEELLSSAPTSTHSRTLLVGTGMSLVDLLAQTTLVKSKSEARTQLAQNAVSVNGRPAAADARVTEASLVSGNIIALRRGKKTWHITKWE
jgi:tyrosyl-tRNA synthetase